MATLETARIKTPVGALVLLAHEGALCALGFDERRPKLLRDLEERFGPLDLHDRPDPAGLIMRLAAYFNGDLGALEDIRVDPGGTPFQQRVWSALRQVAPGQTVSYSELARIIRAPSAVRAVAAANAANPVPIVIPCHRVIGADGTLTGYGGGLERKRWLLEHEGVRLPQQRRLPFGYPPRC